jgi:triacylglycerol lipase
MSTGTPKYPVVLAHGFFGFSELIGIKYFRGVKKYLRKNFPGITVEIPEVAPNDVVEDRASQLWEQVKHLDGKMHMIGHSMGGLDARYLVSPAGLNKADRVFSLTTLSTPHWGTPVADAIMNATQKFSESDIARIKEKLPKLDRAAKKIIKTLKRKGELLNWLLEFLSIDKKGLKNLVPANAREFNKKIIDAPEVHYFSYTGMTGPGEQDYLPALLHIPWAIVYKSDDEIVGGRNDVFVALESGKWGTFKGVIEADHLKIPGHDLSLLGWLYKLLPWVKTFNHYKFYKKLVEDLRELED